MKATDENNAESSSRPSVSRLILGILLMVCGVLMGGLAALCVVLMADALQKGNVSAAGFALPFFLAGAAGAWAGIQRGWLLLKGRL